MAKPLKGLLALAIALVLACVLAEIALALAAPQQTWSYELAANAAMFRADDRLPYALVPGFEGTIRRAEFEQPVRINSLGYHDDEFSLEKPARTFRALVLGDSFTFGWGVERDECYANRLEAILAARAPEGTAVEVVNAGFAAGYYPDTFYLWVKEEASALDPDLVVLGFFVGNDIDHKQVDENVWPEVDADGLPLRVVNRNTEVKDGYWIIRNRKLRYRIPFLRESHLVQLLAKAVSGKTEGPTSEPFVYRDPWEERTAERAATVQRLFAATSELCARRGVPCVVLVIPAVEQVHPDRRELEPGLDLEKPQREFVAFFEREGIAHLDLLGPMRARADERELYFRQDEHWTADGHAVAAELLAERLDELELVPF